MKRLAVAVVAASVFAAAGPAEAVFELYLRADGGMEYLDLSAIDMSGLTDPANLTPDMLTTDPDLQGQIDKMTQDYSGEGWAVGAQGGLVLLDFLDIGIDFRQAGLYLDNDADADLTQIAMLVGFHFLGTDTIVDPSLMLGFGYCYLTTQIPEITGAAGSRTVSASEEQTANGFIGRAGVALDFRFISWMSAGIAGDFSFLYFDGGTERQAWGFNTDVFARLSFHFGV